MDDVEKHREYVRQRTRANQAWWADVIDTYKLGRGCDECDYRKHAVALDFDHIDPAEKMFSIANFRSQVPNEANQAKLVAEIRKCRLLCACCHRVKTHASSDYRNGKWTTPET